MPASPKVALASWRFGVGIGSRVVLVHLFAPLQRTLTAPSAKPAADRSIWLSLALSSASSPGSAPQHGKVPPEALQSDETAPSPLVPPVSHLTRLSTGAPEPPKS